MNVLLANLSSLAMATAHAADAVRKAYQTGRKVEERVKDALHSDEEEVVIMKKSTWIAILAAFAAVLGAFIAVCVYLRRREAELDEYEQLLFSEDFSHEEAGTEEAAEELPEETSAPADEAAGEEEAAGESAGELAEEA